MKTKKNKRVETSGSDTYGPRSPRNTTEEMSTQAGRLGFLAESWPDGRPGSRMSDAIERQEAQGQKELVASEVLPTDGLLRDRYSRSTSYEAQLAAIGIKVLGKVEGDPMFTSVQLPPGWKKETTSHHMWSKLVDDQGRERASIFYKGSWYDREAFINYGRRFRIERCSSKYYLEDASTKVRGPMPAGPEGAKDWAWHEIVDDATKTIVHRSKTVSDDREGPFNQARYDEMERLAEELRIGLGIGYPDWNNPFAYWPAS